MTYILFFFLFFFSLSSHAEELTLEHAKYIKTFGTARRPSPNGMTVTDRIKEPSLIFYHGKFYIFTYDQNNEIESVHINATIQIYSKEEKKDEENDICIHGRPYCEPNNHMLICPASKRR